MAIDAADAKQTAARIFSKAWQDAADQGITTELLAGTALSAALASLVKTQGREAAAVMVDRFASAIRSGKFDK